jgi:hypothetical protein
MAKQTTKTVLVTNKSDGHGGTVKDHYTTVHLGAGVNAPAALQTPAPGAAVANPFAEQTLPMSDLETLARRFAATNADQVTGATRPALPARDEVPATPTRPTLTPTVAPTSLNDDVLASFQRKQAERLETSRANKKNSEDAPLWKAVYSKVDERLYAMGNHIDTASLKAGIMSAQSSAGNNSEYLFAEYATVMIDRAAAPVPYPQLVAYIRDDDFVAAIDVLRKNPRVEEADIRAVATSMHVSADFVRSFLDDRRKAVTYPDSVSVFADGRIRIAEHKLTGDNDSKAVTKNLEVLEELRPAFEGHGYTVETAVALPFTYDDERARGRWVRHEKAADLVPANQEVWSGLLGQPVSQTEYEQATEALASTAVEVVLHAMTPGAAARNQGSATDA